MSPEAVLFAIGTAAVAAVAFAAGYLLRRRPSPVPDTARPVEAEADRLLEEAQTRYKEVILEAKEEAIRIRREAEEDQRERRAELQRREQRLQQRDENLDRKAEALERRDRALAQREKEAEAARQAADECYKQAQRELQQISGLTPEKAQELMLASIENEVRQDAGRRIRGIEQQAKEEAERRARWVIAQAIQRVAADHAVETTQTAVALPNDEMKGRIIGKEGRNIRALEAAAGVDLIIDDTPETVVVSSFDPVRREVARVALQKLMLDGRIHPARIEDLVSRARIEVEADIREEGERAAYEVGVHGLHAELIKTVGRLKYRTSYAQNVLAHSVEVALLAGAMAAEVRADVNVAKRAGFLHDIGKAVDFETDGPHAQVGSELARRFGVPPKVCHAIAAHHFEEEPQTVEAFLVAAADAISAARPGARRETVEAYIKRLQALEELVRSFSGVEKCYALQAGREVRVMVKPEQIDELEVWRLTRDIVKRIEEELQFPGQIKVTVIRETRVVDYAK